MSREISLEEFIETYKPVANHLDDNASWDGMMFETFGDELAFVKSQDPRNIWTIEDDGKTSVAFNGFHLVNRLGYLVCQVPFVEGEEIQIDADAPDTDNERPGELAAAL